MNVTVIVATYGHQWWEHLARTRAVPSARGQGAEVIAIHDYDTDSVAEARNLTAAEASGDWLCFLDGDDELAPGYLDAMREAMRFWNLARPGDLRLNPLLLVPAASYVHEGGRVDAPAFPNRGRWHHLNVAVIGALVPRRLFLDVGGFGRGYEPYEDYELWLRCWRAGATLVEVPGAVYRAFVHEESAHRNPAGTLHRRQLHERILGEHRAAAGGLSLAPVHSGVVFPGAA